MSGVIRQTAMLGQSDGSEVELVVTGTKSYATYETPEGYPVTYDQHSGFFCYARVVNGAYHSTGVPVSEPPPQDVFKHAEESDEVRAAKIQERNKE